MSVVAETTWRCFQDTRLGTASGWDGASGATWNRTPFESAADEVVLLQLADDDVDRTEVLAWRTTLAGLLVSVLIHLWAATNLSGWFLNDSAPSYEPVLETKFTEPLIKTEVEEAIPFELANPNDREMEVREVTHAASLGASQVMEAPKPSAAPPQVVLAETRLAVSPPAGP